MKIFHLSDQHKEDNYCPSYTSDDYATDSDVENCVVLIEDHSCKENSLKSLIMSLGLEVYLGLNGVSEDQNPIILIHSRLRPKAEIENHLFAAKNYFKQAPVCFITGVSDALCNQSNYNDARAALAAAGIMFICG